MSELTIGVVGLGFMGATHVRAWNAASDDGLGCQVGAVADRSPARLTGMSGETGNLETQGTERLFDPAVVRTYERAEDLFADDGVDAVSICTHTDTHVDLALSALESGKHVLVEKPISVETAGVARLASGARAYPRQVCMPAMCMRFWPAWAWLAERVRDGSLGPVRSAAFQRLGSVPAWSGFYADTTRSGGALRDLHIHDTDFIVHAFGPPREVCSAGDAHHLTTLFRNDEYPAHVVAEGGWDHTPGFGFRMRYVVVFEHATADFDLSRDPQLILYRDGNAEPVDTGALTGYDAEVRAFLGAIRGDPVDVPTMDEAEIVSRVLDAEQESCGLGTPVPVGTHGGP